MKATNQKLKVERILKLQDTKTLSFDMKIQRSDDIWDKKRKSKLIHSILNNWPTNSIFIVKEKSIFSIIDGKQRLTILLAFLDDKLILDKSTPAIGDLELAGKKFSDLPEDLKNVVNEYTFDVVQVEEATMEELEEFFYRINSGVPLRQIETTRAILGGKILKFVEDVANTPFFQTKANLSRKSKKRFRDQELVLQILAMIHKEETGFSGKEIETFVRELRNQRIQEELKSKMQNASFYLNQAFVKKEAFLKRIHIPTLFKLVLELQEKALLITPAEFEEWGRNFFTNMPEDYNKACQSGSAKKDAVMTRYKAMKAGFEKHFKNRLVAKEETEETA